jgi:hypothetical protein
MTRPADPLPPITDAHRRQAFAQFHWPGLTFEQAMAVDLRARLIEASAHSVRTREWLASQRAQRPARYTRWCPSAIFGARVKPAPAAHDMAD